MIVVLVLGVAVCSAALWATGSWWFAFGCVAWFFTCFPEWMNPLLDRKRKTLFSAALFTYPVALYILEYAGILPSSTEVEAEMQQVLVKIAEEMPRIVAVEALIVLVFAAIIIIIIKSPPIEQGENHG